MAPRSRGEGKTPHRTLRIENELWERFGAAVAELGTDRSTWLRSAIEWCARQPGAKTPRRPAPAADPGQ